MFDHLRIWTTWKQWEQEYGKASVADTKDLEMLGKSIKTFYYALGTKRSWVQVPLPQPKITDSRLTVRYFFLFRRCDGT